LIFLSSIITYFFQHGSIQEGNSNIGIDLFFIYKLSYPIIYLPVAMFFSLSLPIMTIIFYRDILKSEAFVYALFLFIISFIISISFVENGPRLFHGNFIWQNVFTIYLLFLTNVIYLYNKLSIKSSFENKDILLMFLLFLHFISGFLYLFKYVLTESYS
jgi:hypothetical protein